MQICAEDSADIAVMVSTLPTEIKLDVFGYLPDVKSIISLRLVNQDFNNIYLNNTKTILTRVLATIGGDSSTLHLAFMAMEATGVNHRDRQSVESFLSRFLSRSLPDHIYTLQAVHRLGLFIAATDVLLFVKIQDTAYAHTAAINHRYSVTERRRLCRALCMVEIGGKVFHGTAMMPGMAGYTFRAPFPDLEKKYWRTFSKREVSQLYVVRLITQSALLQGNLPRNSFLDYMLT